MDVYEAIEKRRTIRIYKNPASEEQLRKIILAGTKAPSAVNRRPWEFTNTVYFLPKASAKSAFRVPCRCHIGARSRQNEM